MAKPKLPSQRESMRNLKKRIEKYMLLVQGVYDTYNLEASKVALRTGFDGEKPFRFSDYPSTGAQVRNLLKNWSNDMSFLIYRSTSEEWKQSNLMQDLIADKTMAYYYGTLHGQRTRKYYQVNSDALKAFQERRDYGMNLSQRIWVQSQEYKKGLEDALSVGIQKGMSAVTLSKRVSKYLQDYPQLQKDYKEKYGTATDGVNCEYRSMRLARNEINLAYRTAEQKRWEQMDFIIGKEIHTSDVHEDRMPKGDMCDELAGKYPKDFLWRGWHPNCYSDDSEVLTNNGWKLFKDVSADDSILSLNPDTRNVEWVGISDMQCRKHHGDMVHFFNKTLDCLVTPEHQMVYLNKCNGVIKKRPASEYKKTHGGFYRGCEHNAQDIESIEIGGVVYDFDTYCEFMAYYLSDGSTQHESGICIAQKDGERHKQKIIDCLRRMGYEPKNYGETVYIYNSHLNRHLQQFGKAHDKLIPTEIKNASRRQIRLFLDAYLRCDGHTQLRDGRRFTGSHGNIFEQKREGRVYFTTSDLMARDLSELILKAGHRPSFYVHEPKTTITSKGRVIKSNYPCWSIRECYSTTATVFEKENVPYDGFVYDVTLERNHIMYIRRNGKCFWGSNCMCYEVPIIKKDYDFFAPDDAPAENEVTDVPQNYKEWVKNNAERIGKAEERGTLPYFLKDNPDYKKIISGEEELSTLEKAKLRHEARTPEEVEAIKSQARMRQKSIASAKQLLSDFEGMEGVDTSALRDAYEHARWEDVRSEALALAQKKRSIIEDAISIKNELEGISDVDLQKIQEALQKESLVKVQTQTEALNKIKTEINSLTNIEDPMAVAKQFSMQEAVTVNSKIQDFFNRYSWDFNSEENLEKLRKGLEHEIDWMGTKGRKYSTWQVSQDAYKKRLALVEHRIKMFDVRKDISAQIETINASKSIAGKNIVSEFESLFADNETSLDTLKLKADDVRKKAAAIEASQRYRDKKKAGIASTSSFVPKSDAETKSDFVKYMKSLGHDIPEDDIVVDKGFIHLQGEQHMYIYRGNSVETRVEHDQLWNHNQVGGGHGGRGGYVQTGNSFYINRMLRRMNLTGKIDAAAEAKLLAEGATKDDLKTMRLLEKKCEQRTVPQPILVTRYVDLDALDTIFGRQFTPFAHSSLRDMHQEMRATTQKGVGLTPDPAYMSASTNEKQNVFWDSRDVKLVIEVPPNTPFYLTDNIQESEVVFGRNTKIQYLSSYIDTMTGKWGGNAEHLVVRCRVIP